MLQSSHTPTNDPVCLHGLNWKECLTYLDDVIVLGNSFHLLNLKAVLTRLRKHNLKLKTKCCMFREEKQFLGRIVSDDGVSVTPENIHCVAQWLIPRNWKDVESFLGYMNYHRGHIKDYATLASTLYNLTKSKVYSCGTKRKIMLLVPLHKQCPNQQY